MGRFADLGLQATGADRARRAVRRRARRPAGRPARARHAPTSSTPVRAVRARPATRPRSSCCTRWPVPACSPGIRPRRAAPALPGRHLRPALARPGHLASARFSLDDCADDVVAVADALGIDRFVRCRLLDGLAGGPAGLAPPPRPGRRRGAVREHDALRRFGRDPADAARRRRPRIARAAPRGSSGAGRRTHWRPDRRRQPVGLAPVPVDDRAAGGGGGGAMIAAFDSSALDRRHGCARGRRRHRARTG